MTLPSSTPPTEVLAFGPPAPPERSLWLHQALRGEVDAPPLSDDLVTDVAIVGGGYTGLWTALRLLDEEPGLRVTVLEADVCGGGASGRNGGFVDTWTVKFFALEQVCGTAEAIRLCRASIDVLSELRSFCTTHGIDADLRVEGGLWTATTPAGVGSWRPLNTVLARHDLPTLTELSPSELQAEVGSPRFLGGAREHHQARVQPALLARGLRRVARERGVQVFEHTPVRTVVAGSRHGDPTTLTTPAGTVTASKVVLATGVHLGQVHELRNAMALIGTDMVATAPIPERLDAYGFSRGLVVSDSSKLVTYFRATADGRLAWGKGGGSVGYGARIGRHLNGASPRAGAVAADLRWHYPELGDVRIDRSWTGGVDRTYLGIPFFFTSARNPSVVMGGGYSGNGVGPSLLGARFLTSLVLERDDVWTRSGLARRPRRGFPPEPARWAGALAVRRSIELNEARARAGRPAPTLTRLLERLSPPGPAEPR